MTKTLGSKPLPKIKTKNKHIGFVHFLRFDFLVISRSHRSMKIIMITTTKSVGVVFLFFPSFCSKNWFSVLLRLEKIQNPRSKSCVWTILIDVVFIKICPSAFTTVSLVLMIMRCTRQQQHIQRRKWTRAQSCFSFYLSLYQSHSQYEKCKRYKGQSYHTYCGLWLFE